MQDDEGEAVEVTNLLRLDERDELCERVLMDL
jgi:hypothetical protein